MRRRIGQITRPFVRAKPLKTPMAAQQVALPRRPLSKAAQFGFADGLSSATAYQRG
jgi:hypothetical protein